MPKEIFSELDQLETHLASGKKIPEKLIYLGSENHLCEDLMQAYHNTIKKKEPFFERTLINGLEASPQELYSELFTIPLFASARMIAVKHADYLFKRIESESNILKRFEHDLKIWPKSIYCFLQFDSSAIPKKFALLKTLSVTFKPSIPKGDRLISYYIRKANKMGCKIESKTLEFLAGKCAWDFYRIQQVFDQLTLHLAPLNEEISENLNVTQEMIEELCADWDGDFYFAILDDIAEKKIQCCIQKIHQHNFDDGRELFSSFAKLFVDSYRYFYFTKLGLPSAEILDQLNMKTAHPYMIKKNQQRYQKLIQHYPENSISFVFKYLSKLDEALKIESKEKHRTLLVMFLASLGEH